MFTSFAAKFTGKGGEEGCCGPDGPPLSNKSGSKVLVVLTVVVVVVEREVPVVVAGAACPKDQRPVVCQSSCSR